MMENEANVSVPKPNRWAIVSPVFGLLSLLTVRGVVYVFENGSIDQIYYYLCGSLLMAPAGLVTGIVALRQIKGAGNLISKGLAITGIVISVIGFLPWALIVLAFMIM